MTYDEAIKRVDAIVSALERADAIGLDEYAKLSAEATELLKYCRGQILQMEEKIIKS